MEIEMNFRFDLHRECPTIRQWNTDEYFDSQRKVGSGIHYEHDSSQVLYSRRFGISMERNRCQNDALVANYLNPILVV